MESVPPIKQYREREGLTQDQFAKGLGVARTTVARWETGKRKIDEELVEPIHEMTGIPKRELRPDLVARLSKLVEVAG